VSRLYNKNGEHILSILPCIYDDKDIDIATLDGKVIWCTNGSKDDIDFLTKLTNIFGVEKLQEEFSESSDT